MFRTIDNRLLRDEPTVSAIGCDFVTCRSLKAALRSSDLRLEFHASIEAFLEACDPTRPGCILLDLAQVEGPLPEVWRRLAERWIHLPVVLLAPAADLGAAVRAVRSGAFDFLPRPWTQQGLAEATAEALEWEADHHAEILDRVRIEKRLARLGDGERQVLELIVQGMSNGRIALCLGLSVRAVETRRANLMKKMRAKGLGDLLRQAITALRPALMSFSA